MKHLLCSNSYNIKITDSRTPAIWTCSKFYFRELHLLLSEISKMSTKTLIYHHQKRTMSIFTLKNTHLPSSETYHVNIHAEKLKEYHKHLSIAHLNTQSMSSTFDEFQVIINENQFDIVTLSETLLRENKQLPIDYVKIRGYNLFHKNREQKLVVE